jgi:asparagine synthase (glutamine-hydrolysing)
VQDVCNSSNLNFIDRYLAKAVWIDESYIKQLTKGLNVYSINEFLTDFERKCKYHDPFYKLMYFNQKLSLPDDMLVKVDRMSMSYSLETRTPFLDYRLIEYMAHVHKDVKMHHYERKTVLRNTIGLNLPRPILTAPKRGFSVPLREWFKEDSFNEKLDTLDKTMPFLNKGIISTISKMNQNGEKDFGNFIWMLFIIQKTTENDPEQKN